MKKLLLLSALFIFACSSDIKVINASSLQEKDGKTTYLGEVFSGYAAYKGMTTKWVKGYKNLKKGNICQLLLEYKNGKAVGMNQFYDTPTEIITIENIEYQIGTKLKAKADENQLITYFEDGTTRSKIQIKWDGLWPVPNGDGIQYNSDGTVKRKAVFKDGEIIKK